MKFQVFRDGKIVKDFSLSAAYMFGADEIPLRVSSSLICKNGVIECTRKILESAGIALLWPVDGFGRILLPTTRLPKRDEPYNLNVELARARLMQITLKREDWSLFEDSDAHSELADDARRLFIESLKNITDPAKASKLADESLRKALIYSERLTDQHAEMVFSTRCRNKSFGRHSLGCSIDPDMLSNPTYLKRLLEMFGSVTLPVSWAQIEPEKGQYDFSAIDRCLDFIGNKRLAICAGPLLCFTEKNLPQWLIEERWEFEKIREKAYEFVARVVARYARCVHVWRVVSGLNAENFFGFNFEQIIEMTRAACLAARSADGKSRKVVEILYPWGEYYAYSSSTIPPLVYADMILQSGISFDTFGLQLCFGKDSPGRHIRDLMQVSAKLDSFAGISKTLHITGVSIPGQHGDGELDPKTAGLWHKKWDQAIQAEWVGKLYKIALGKPFVSAITYSGFADNDSSEIIHNGLLSKNFTTKKAYVAMAKLQKRILNR